MNKKPKICYRVKADDDAQRFVIFSALLCLPRFRIVICLIHEIERQLETSETTEIVVFEFSYKCHKTNVFGIRFF